MLKKKNTCRWVSTNHSCLYPHECNIFFLYVSIKPLNTGSLLFIGQLPFSLSRLSQIQLDAVSAFCPSAFTAALRCFPSTPMEPNVIHTGKSRHPTSTGNSQVCHPHFFTEFVGLCLLSSFRMHLSSQGTVSSTLIRVLGSRLLD